MRLGEITRKTLSFYRNETEAKAVDLVEIAEDALRIHLLSLPAKAVTLTKRFPIGRSFTVVPEKYSKSSRTFW